MLKCNIAWNNAEKKHENLNGTLDQNLTLTLDANPIPNSNPNSNEKKRSEKRKHCALAVVRRSHFFCPAADLLPGA